MTWGKGEKKEGGKGAKVRVGGRGDDAARAGQLLDACPLLVEAGLAV